MKKILAFNFRQGSALNFEVDLGCLRTFSGIIQIHSGSPLTIFRDCVKNKTTLKNPILDFFKNNPIRDNYTNVETKITKHDFCGLGAYTRGPGRDPKICTILQILLYFDDDYRDRNRDRGNIKLKKQRQRICLWKAILKGERYKGKKASLEKGFQGYLDLLTSGKKASSYLKITNESFSWAIAAELLTKNSNLWPPPPLYKILRRASCAAELCISSNVEEDNICKDSKSPLDLFETYPELRKGMDIALTQIARSNDLYSCPKEAKEKMYLNEIFIEMIDALQKRFPDLKDLLGMAFPKKHIHKFFANTQPVPSYESIEKFITKKCTINRHKEREEFKNIFFNWILNPTLNWKKKLEEKTHLESQEKQILRRVFAKIEEAEHGIFTYLLQAVSKVTKLYNQDEIKFEKIYRKFQGALKKTDPKQKSFNDLQACVNILKIADIWKNGSLRWHKESSGHRYPLFKP